MVKNIPDYDLINLSVQALSEKYFFHDSTIRNEIKRRGLVNKYTVPVELNISLEEFESNMLSELSKKHKVSIFKIKSYAFRTYNLTNEDIMKFDEKRKAKRHDLSHISDEELLKSFVYLIKTYGVLQTSITPERNKRGLVKTATPPIKKEIRTMSDFELFENSLNNLANAYNVSKDTISRERKRRRENGETSYKTNHKNRKLEHVTTEELFALSIPGVCKKYNVGETTVTMERRRRK